ncbi:hypothetical protein HK096_011414, partial [Nowakowskiella sp. JEL0078]
MHSANSKSKKYNFRSSWESDSLGLSSVTASINSVSTELPILSTSLSGTLTPTFSEVSSDMLAPFNGSVIFTSENVELLSEESSETSSTFPPSILRSLSAPTTLKVNSIATASEIMRNASDPPIIDKSRLEIVEGAGKDQREKIVNYSKKTRNRNNQRKFRADLLDKNGIKTDQQAPTEAVKNTTVQQLSSNSSETPNPLKCEESSKSETKSYKRRERFPKFKTKLQHVVNPIKASPRTSEVLILEKKHEGSNESGEIIKVPDPVISENEESHRENPNATLFISGLKDTYSDEIISDTLNGFFSKWGIVSSVKTFRNKNQIPFSFVAFQEVKDSMIAIIEAKNSILPITTRHLKVERAKINRKLQFSILRNKNTLSDE